MPSDETARWARETISAVEVAFLRRPRRATLATVDAAGRPRLVPICFVVEAIASDEPVIYSPIDDKPKRSSDPLQVARVRDIAARPEVTLLADRWDEDWSHLGWIRIRGRAEVLDASDADRQDERAGAIAALRDKYAQYAVHDLEHRPIVAVHIDEVTTWGDLARYDSR